MIIKETALANEAISIVETKFGNLYFFDQFLITEIFEGESLGSKEFKRIFALADDCYGKNKPIGLISHRIFPYAVNVFELIPLSKNFENVIANAVVAYTDISLKNFELEQKLLAFKGKFFNNLDSAIEWIKKEVKKNNKTI